MPEVDESELQVLAQLLREHSWVVDARTDHKAGLALAVDPIAEVSSFHLDNASVVFWRDVR